MKRSFLVGERIYLRRIDRGDLEDNYFQWLNDQEVTRWMQTGIYPNSMESMLDFYESVSNSRNDIVMAVVLKDDDRHIGNIGLHHINYLFQSAEIGILIGEKDCWGKKYATESILLIAAYAFKRLNLNRLQAGAVVENQGSIKAFEKAGFIKEGIARQAYYCEGEHRDCVNMSLLRREWGES